MGGDHRQRIEAPAMTVKKNNGAERALRTGKKNRVKSCFVENRANGKLGRKRKASKRRKQENGQTNIVLENV